jgi:hypothetical protein
MDKSEIVEIIKHELDVIAECSVFHGQIEHTTVITESAIEKVAEKIMIRLNK